MTPTPLTWSRLFYSSYLLQTLCHLLEFVSDLRQFRWEHNSRVFHSTLHHAHHRNRNGIRWMFDIHNGFREGRNGGMRAHGTVTAYDAIFIW